MTHELKQDADLYAWPYEDSLKGRHVAKTVLVRGLVIVVEGPGSKPGTVACHAEHDPDIRQEDLPVKTLYTNYQRLL